jgi:GT2 family glycosyltransferase
MIRDTFERVEVEDMNDNPGFSKANNVAIARGAGKYVLVLNPNTRITQNALEELLLLMESRSEIGICGCRLEREDGSIDHAAKRSARPARTRSSWPWRRDSPS